MLFLKLNFFNNLNYQLLKNLKFGFLVFINFKFVNLIILGLQAVLRRSWNEPWREDFGGQILRIRGKLEILVD